MSPGQRLREAREARHLTLGEIARRTCIQMRFLQAIDDDELHAVPATHVRLFIREYARIVDVDPEELYPLIPESIPSRATPAPRVVGEGSDGLSFDGTLPEVQTVSFADRVVDEEERRQNRALLDRLSSGKGVKLVGGGTSGWMLRGALILLLAVAGYFGVRALVGKGGGTAEAPLPDSVAELQIVPRESVDSTTVAAAEADSLTLEGRASGRVWFALVSDGKKSEQGTIDSGDVRTWRADKEFRISLSNAGGLELVLDGRSLGTLGPRKTSVRNQVITAEGLKLHGPAARIRERAAATSAGTQGQTNSTPQTNNATGSTRSTSSRRPQSTNTRSTRRDRSVPLVTPTQPRGEGPPPR